jgi:bifunctional non-homologous end joining protein LigD
MPAPYQPMLLTAANAPPIQDGWAHEMKMDGFRCIAEVTARRVRLWSRGGNDMRPRVPELGELAVLGDVVLDGELVVVTDDGRADFELLAGSVNRRTGDRSPHPPITFYAFDALRLADWELCDLPWSERREVLDDLGLGDRTAGAARTTRWSLDGAAMHQATAAVIGEGTCSKRLDSPYRPGRSRHWLKIKHRVVETFDVAGWRPSTPSRPGGLIVAQAGDIIGVATLALPQQDRKGLVDLIERYGRRHPTGSITIGEGVQATVHYTSRTPTNGHLREAFVDAVYPTMETT